MGFEQLKNYYKILRDEREAKFLKSDLDTLIKKVEKIMEKCTLCERKCKVNRLDGEIGFCRVPNKMLIASEFLHFGEEFFFIPSHTIFFMGCNFHCQFCQNWSISQWYEEGYEIEPKELAEIIKIRKIQGSKNVNFVGGEPTPYLLWILKTLRELKDLNVNVPIIWNSNFYMSKKVMKILNKVIDVYLSDFKYGNDECARKLSLVENYVEIVTRNLLLAKGEIVIRHLILPNHVECCSYPILEWIAKNLGNKCIVNIMDQYTPYYKVWEKEELAYLRRGIRESEFRSVIEKAKKLGLTFII